MTPEAKTPLSPEPDWIEMLRLSELLKDSETDRNPLWPLLCDVVEAGEACVDGIIPLAGSKTEHFVLSLAALRAEVERDA